MGVSVSKLVSVGVAVSVAVAVSVGGAVSDAVGVGEGVWVAVPVAVGVWVAVPVAGPYRPEDGLNGANRAKQQRPFRPDVAEPFAAFALGLA